MPESDKTKRKPIPAGYVYKTAADFMRWRQVQKALEKKSAEAQDKADETVKLTTET